MDEHPVALAMTDHARPWMIWIDQHLTPRATHLTQGIWYQIMGGICLFIATIIVIPLPLTNMVPAISIAILTLGMMCRDGLVAAVGAGIGLLWCLMWLVLAAAIGVTGLVAIYTFLFN